MFNFEGSPNAKMVLSRGLRRHKEKVLHLDRWAPKVREGEHAKKVWVRKVGLPLHLWCWEVFKKLEDSCGGFVAVDEDIAHPQHMKRA